jgi:hypothetical protein
MGMVRWFAAAGLEQAARSRRRPVGLAIAAIDETGQKGRRGDRESQTPLLGCVRKAADEVNAVHISGRCCNPGYIRDR